MKSFLSLIAIPLAMLAGTASCNSQGNATPGKKQVQAKSDAKKTSPGLREGSDYTEFTRARILDKFAFSNPVEAFSLLIPKEWKFDGNVLWTMPGNICAGINRGFKAASPDGKYSFEIYPNYNWGYTTDQQLAQINQNNTSQFCGFGEPLDAEHYVKQVFLPREIGNPTIEEIKQNEGGKQSIQQEVEKYRQEMMSYGAAQVMFYPSAIHAKVKWNDGSVGIVLCGIVIGETTVANPYNGTYSKNYTSATSQKILFRYPAAESQKAGKILSVIMSSIRTNQDWKKTVDNFWVQVRRQNNVINRERINLMDAYTQQIGANAIKRGQQNLDNIDANMRSWEAKQQSQDRMHTNFIKSIREVENYRDATGKVELSSGYNHAWSRSDGSSFIMTDSPNFDPSSVFRDQQWKEMKRVD